MSYWAFVAPALLWIGGALLIWRLADLVLVRGRRAVAVLLTPVAGPLARILSHSLARQRAPLARAIMLLALTVAFAGSTATFNATYQAQAEVDAQLTNGADVTVTEAPVRPCLRTGAEPLAAVRGVRAVEPIQHRFAYIGGDLQDLYGVNPDSIGTVTALQDTYFRGGTADSLMNTLASQPDSILVSAETVSDFQLGVGDTVNLRLPNANTHQLSTVPFRYVGVVTEFPTAPKDSFFVANAGYVAHQTGTDAVGTFLIDTGGRDTGEVAARVRALLGTSATVTDIATTRGTVGSSLTAVNLAGLTRIELGFGLCLAAAAGALVLALGLPNAGELRHRQRAGRGSPSARFIRVGGIDGVDPRRARRCRRVGLGVVAHARQRAHGRLRPAARGTLGAVGLLGRHRGDHGRRDRRGVGGHRRLRPTVSGGRAGQAVIVPRLVSDDEDPAARRPR